MKILNHPSFRFAYYECNGFDFAYNWEVFTTEIISEIWKNKHGGNLPFRPHFIIEGYKPIPTNPVALLIGNPITKFIAACHEDGIDPEEAINQLTAGKFPSFRFFPQSRYIGFGGQPIYLWKSPDHIKHFGEALDIGEPPKIYNKEIDFQYSYKLSELYKDDFTLYESIKDPKTLAKYKSDVNPTLWKKMLNAGFAVGKFSASGFKPTPPENLAERESICRACDQWDVAALRNTGRCKKCGCSTWAKLRMATERCPLGKWEAVSVEDSKQ